MLADFSIKSAIFSRPGAELNVAASTALGPDRRQNGRVANDLCHSPECNQIGHFVTLAARTTTGMESTHDENGDPGQRWR